MTRRSPNPWSPSTPSSVNVPLLPEGAVQARPAGVTPTSLGLTEPLTWNGSWSVSTVDSLRTLIPPT